MRLAGARVDGIRVLRIEGQGSYGQRRLIVGEWRPAITAVGGLPHASLGRAQVDHVGVARVNDQRLDPSTDVGRVLAHDRVLHRRRPDVDPSLRRRGEFLAARQFVCHGLRLLESHQARP